MDLIATRDLAIAAGRRVLARGIGLTLAAGEIVAVLGPNGAGKSTLFRTLLGLVPPAAGEVALSGTPVAALPRREIARRLALVPQAMEPAFPWTALDFVLMGRTALLGSFAAPGRRDRAAAEAALAGMGIAHLAGRPVTRLSGGERQLVLIARALAQEAPALLLDEPAAALDFANRELLADLLLRLSAGGLGLVFTTHDPGQAARLAGRVLTIDRAGRSRLAPTAQQLTDDSLAALYGMSAGAVRRARTAGAG